jgi:hypothetical protein
VANVVTRLLVLVRRLWTAVEAGLFEFLRRNFAILRVDFCILSISNAIKPSLYPQSKRAIAVPRSKSLVKLLIRLDRKGISAVVVRE